MLPLVVIGFAILLGVVRYIIFKSSRKRLEKLIDQFPGPRAFPIIGNIHMFVGTPAEVIRKCGKLKKYESPCRVWLMHKPILIVSDPETFQIVTTKTTEKGDTYKFMKDFLGEGLITANGEKWKKNRRLLNPAFNSNLLYEDFLRVFNEENNKLIELLDIEAEKEKKFDLWPYVLNCALNTTSLNAMNYRDEEGKSIHRQFGKMGVQAALMVSQRIYKPWLHPQILYNLYKRLTGYDKIFHHLHTLPKVIIEAKRKEYDNQQKIGDINFNDKEESGKKNKTFIDILFDSHESKTHFSDDQIVDEILTIMAAGSDTTTLTVCTTLHMLAMNQNYQDQVYEEIQTALGDHEGDADVEHFKQMPFLEQCIKETLRRFTVAPFIFRNVTEDIELNDGRVIPAGTTVLLSITKLHINPELYPNPLQWNPQNFSSEAIASRHCCSFVPFSYGSRSCIGYKYAMLSIKVTLVILLRRYKFFSDEKIEDYKISFDLAMRNIKGYHVRLERR